MSGFEALGLVATVFQTVSFAHEVIKSFYDFYNDGPTGFDVVQQNLGSMNRESIVLRQHLNTLNGAETDDADLTQLLGRTEKAALQLKAEIDYVLAKRRAGSVASAMRTQVRYWRRKDVIQEMTLTLENCQKTAQTLLQNRNVQTNDLIRFEQSSGFSALSDEVKAALQQLKTGQEDISNAIESGFQKMEIQRATEMEKHKLAARGQKLLDSLDFPERLARQSRILDPNEASFGPGFFRDAEDEPYFPRLDIGLKFREPDTRLGSASSDQRDGLPSYPSDRPAVAKRANREMQKLRDWIDQGSHLFWISGRAGSGKSTLMKFLAQREAAHFGGEVEILTHYFWRAGSPLEKSSKGMFLSLVHQMLSGRDDRIQQVLACFPTALEMMNHSAWNESTLKLVLRSLVSSSPASLIIFIDGLDEMDNIDEISEVLGLVTAQDDYGKLRFIVASRPEWVILQDLQHHPTIHVHDVTWHNMMLYSERKLSSAMTKLSWSLNEQRVLYDRLADKAEGVFLWLVLSTRILKRSILQHESKDEIHEHLDAMPSELEGLFTDMWKRNSENFPRTQRIAAGYIKAKTFWIELKRPRIVDMGMQLPQQVTDVMGLLFAIHGEGVERFAACQSQPGPKELVEWATPKLDEVTIRCKDLLVVEDNPWYVTEYHEGQRFNPSISFLHRSVYDYFTTTEAGKSLLSIHPLEYHDYCFRHAKACIIARPLLPAEFEVIIVRSAFEALSAAISHGADAAQCTREILELCDRFLPPIFDRPFLYLLGYRNVPLLKTWCSGGYLSQDQATGLLRYTWREDLAMLSDESLLQIVDQLIKAGGNVTKSTSHYFDTFDYALKFAHFRTPFAEFLLHVLATQCSVTFWRPCFVSSGPHYSLDTLLKILERLLLEESLDFGEKVSFTLDQGTDNKFAKMTGDQPGCYSESAFAAVSVNLCWIYYEILKPCLENMDDQTANLRISAKVEPMLQDLSPAIEIAVIARWIDYQYLVRTEFGGLDVSKLVSSILTDYSAARFRLAPGSKDPDRQHLVRTGFEASDTLQIYSDLLKLFDDSLGDTKQEKDQQLRTLSRVFNYILVAEDLGDFEVGNEMVLEKAQEHIRTARQTKSVPSRHVRVLDIPTLVRELNCFIGNVPPDLLNDIVPPMEEWPLQLSAQMIDQGYQMAFCTKRQFELEGNCNCGYTPCHPNMQCPEFPRSYEAEGRSTALPTYRVPGEDDTLSPTAPSPKSPAFSKSPHASDV